jgi:hypothetical protein
MSYSEFTFQSLRDQLALHLMQDTSLFAHIEAVPTSEYLQTTLQENVALALNINTEKARSEMIIAPMLIEVRKILKKQVSLFSGVELQVDAALGLTGVCDYIIGKSTNQVYVSAPAVIIVEAKNENIKASLPQGIAAMYAAKIYNEREHNAVDRILGIVTTGSNWKFLTLEDTRVLIDYDEYLIDQAGKILAIILQALMPEPQVAMLQQG